jgi:hypothetical protein
MGTDPEPMICFIEKAANDRKRRLYAVGCCRHLELRGFLLESLYQEALLTAEQFADRKASTRKLKEARDAVEAAHPNRFGSTSVGYAAWALRGSLSTRNHVAGFWVSEAYRNTLTSLTRGNREWNQEVHEAMRVAANHAKSTLAVFVRCVHGNPFRPVAVDPVWLTSTVVALAEGIYAERAFDRLPILADALQDAGCEDDDILNHCRGDGPHVRGCWVVDLILGKQ